MNVILYNSGQHNNNNNNNNTSFKKFLIKNPASFDDTLLREKTSTEVKKLTGQPAWIKHDLSVIYI